MSFLEEIITKYPQIHGPEKPLLLSRTLRVGYLLYCYREKSLANQSLEELFKEFTFRAIDSVFYDQ